MEAHRAVFAVFASHKANGGREALSAVVRFADYKIAVFGRNRHHIKLALVYKHLAPEARDKLAKVMPGLTVIVGAVDKGKILGHLRPVNVH